MKLWISVIAAVLVAALSEAINETPQMQRRQAGAQARTNEFHCDWMSNFPPSSQPVFNVKRWIMDDDENGDGQISPDEHCKAMLILRVAGYLESRWVVNQTDGTVEEVPLGSKEVATRYNISQEYATVISDSLKDEPFTNCRIDVTEADKNRDGTTTACEMLLYSTNQMKMLEGGKVFNATNAFDSAAEQSPSSEPDNQPVSPVDNLREVRQQTGAPARAPEFHCDWMSNFPPSSQPVFNVKRWIMDDDENGDGQITPDEHCMVMLNLRVAGYVDSHLVVNRTDATVKVVPLGSKEVAARYNISREHVTVISESLKYEPFTNCRIDVTQADKNRDGNTTTCEMLLYATNQMNMLEGGKVFNAENAFDTTVSPPPRPEPEDNSWIVPSAEGFKALKEKVRAILNRSASTYLKKKWRKHHHRH